MILSELAPVVGAQQAEFYVRDSRERAAPQAAGELRLRRAGRARQDRGAGRGPDRPGGHQPAEGAAGEPVQRRASASSRASANGRRATSWCCRSCSRARPRACWSWPPSSASAPATRRSSTSSPRASASSSTRSKPTCAPRTCSSSRSRSPTSCSSRQEELQRTNEELQDKARLLAAAQRGGGSARTSEVEQARQALEDKADAARPHVEVQVRVPGQHEPRAEDAAQQPADPVRPAVPEPRGQPHRAAGGLRQDHPFLRQRPADADQRHPRPVQDRVRHRRRRCQRAALRRPLPLRGAHLPPRRRSQGASSSCCASIRGCRRRW